VTSAGSETAATADEGGKAGKRAGIAILVTVASVVAAVFLFGAVAYLWIKAVHVVAIISWMAGLLYLPRLFIYHCDAKAGTAQSETFKVMERRLLSIIMTPAMLVSWLLGLWLGWTSGVLLSGWFLAKLACVVALTATHGYLARAVKAFAADANDKPPRHWRIVNEVPTLLMVGIVILVIVKPF